MSSAQTWAVVEMLNIAGQLKKHMLTCITDHHIFFVAFDDSGSSVVYCCHICTGVRAKLCASSFAALISFTMSDAPGPPPESGCCETGQQ